jgi:signal transduction histidine kinase
MKIWQKILVGFLSVIALVSVGGVMTSWNYNLIAESYQNIVIKDLAAIENVEEMERLLLDMDQWIRSYQYAGGEMRLRRFQDGRRRWLVLGSELQTYMNENPKAEPLVKSLIEATRSWMDSIEEAARDKSNKLAPLPPLDNVRPYYRGLSSEQSIHLSQGHDSLMKTVENGATLAWRVRVIAVLVGLVACLWVIRSVKGPLDRLSSATSALASGQFEMVTPTSNDELGHLTLAFNQMSRSLKEWANALEKQRRLAVQSSEMKTQFLANTSHELRTPLNTIVGYSQLILDGLARSKEEERKYLLTIQESSKTLLNIINDILDVSRIESGQVELDIETVSVKEVLGKVEEHMRLPAEKKKLTLTMEQIEPGLRVRGNAGRLSQVMLNLVGNAVKFTHAGKVSIDVRTDPSGDWVCFTVTDTGIGIPKDRQRFLFEKFVQADGSMTRQYGGTGLGLSVSKSLMQMMGGNIELESEGEGKGTTVRCMLPREKSKEVPS